MRCHREIYFPCRYDKQLLHGIMQLYRFRFNIIVHVWIEYDIDSCATLKTNKHELLCACDFKKKCEISKKSKEISKSKIENREKFQKEMRFQNFLQLDLFLDY